MNNPLLSLKSIREHIKRGNGKSTEIIDELVNKLSSEFNCTYAVISPYRQSLENIRGGVIEKYESSVGKLKIINKQRLGCFGDNCVDFILHDHKINKHILTGRRVDDVFIDDPHRLFNENIFDLLVSLK